jgi:serine/threonine-protein kinase
MLPTAQAQFPMTDPKVGQLIAKRYQLQELIGTGSMGQVYHAKDILLGGVAVAIKFLTLSIHNQKIRVQERFEREAKTSALLSQKSIHIVRVMDYGVDENGTPFYVMEYLQGKSLNDIIRLQPLSLAKFLSMARQISLGLQCAHQGIPVDGEICPIIHRDIKPSNILVMQDPSFGELVKVLDFGIAKLLQPDSAKTNCYLGTLTYSSPEQMEGQELDNRSDIYSLGVMMFEMLTGKIPIQANTESFGGWYKAHQFQTPRSFAETAPRLKLPLGVEDLVMSCLAKAPGDRPQSISEILQALVSVEQRYGVIAPVNQYIGEAFVKQTLVPEAKSLEQARSATEICQLTSWPQDKPIADIAFPYPIRINNEVAPALWVMLPQQEIQKRLQSTRYNQFLFITSPHPMVLWITVLHTREHSPKWFPYYLDLKTRQGQETTRLLGETGCYRLLLFARELPQRAHACLLLNIAPTQCQLLQEWLIASQTLVSDAPPQVSKTLLKEEFEKLKPQVLMKIQVISTHSQITLLG